MAHKILTGRVTSAQRDKTITVTVTTRETHPLYRKQYTVNTKYTAHDEKNDANVGDIVTIIETRPISKTKSFTLKSIDERSKGSVEVKEADELVATKQTPDAEAKEDA